MIAITCIYTELVCCCCYSGFIKCVFFLRVAVDNDESVLFKSMLYISWHMWFTCGIFGCSPGTDLFSFGFILNSRKNYTCAVCTCTWHFQIAIMHIHVHVHVALFRGVNTFGVEYLLCIHAYTCTSIKNETKCANVSS